MCEQALRDSAENVNKNADTYKANWGNLLEYMDMKESSNITNILITTLPQAEASTYVNRSRPSSPFSKSILFANIFS